MQKPQLKNTALFVLFVTSYLPLFGLLILRQIKQNKEYLNFSDITIDSITVALSKFGLSYLLCCISVFGLYGLTQLLHNLENKINNGILVKVIEIENKNNEAIAYISTYIVPFIFQDTNDIFDLLSIIVVLVIIFLIYVKSNMIVINPILNITHSLFQVQYTSNGKKKKGYVIAKESEFNEEDEIKINQISNNIFYGQGQTN